MDMTEDFYNTCLERFQQITKKPALFLEANNELCDQLKTNLKETYDFTKSEEIKTAKSNALTKLMVQNFDLEQIWQQLELQNESLMLRSVSAVSKLVAGKDRVLFKNLENLAVEEVQNESSEEEVIEHEREESPSDEESLASNDESKVEQPKKTKTSIVDDDFFKLDEMEQFLQAEEKKLDDPDSGNDSEEDEEEEDDVSVNLFEGSSEDDEDPARLAKYKDFFVSQERPKETSRNKFLEQIEDEAPSSFELRQSRLNKKIEEIEEDAIQDKPWQLKGEIKADNRPQNSLLEEVVEFDLTTRPAPVITEQTTMQLEDIIKQRIKDKVFDSVERKAKPVDTLLEYKKKIVLDQEKSKESLAQIYEKEYLEQRANLDPENSNKDETEPELHQEINSQMNNLFQKLDALSNFHFTPKAAIPELKIVSNLPVVQMEEVAPVAASDATFLAPEEVKPKSKGDFVGKDERTSTDKKRERRKKKLKQKMHAKIAKNVKPGLGNKYSKEKLKKDLGRLGKGKNVDKLDESSGDKSVKSSKAFFTQLQEQVKSQIKEKATSAQSKKRDKYSNAKKFKL